MPPHTRPEFAIPALLILMLTGCALPAAAPATAMTGMANPASVYCIQQGGKLLPRVDNAGNAYALCQLVDGRLIEEWTLFRQQNMPPQP